MMNKKKFSFSAALLLAAALIASGCQQQQKPADPTPNPTPTPDPKPNPAPTPLAETVQFQGNIEYTAEGEKLATTYEVTVTLSHNRVAASAEGSHTGFLYMGSNEYDSESNAIDVSLVNVKDANQTLSLTASYQKANKVLMITEFGGIEVKAVLPMVTRKDANKLTSNYTLPVNLPTIGESVVLIQVNGEKATVAVVAGTASKDGKINSVYTYRAHGYVRRGTVYVRIPLDTEDINKAKQVLEMEAVVDSASGRVRDLKTTVLDLRETGETTKQHNGLKATRLPRFKPVRLKFTSTTAATKGDYELELKVEPVVTGKPGKIEDRETYAMTAQFFYYDNPLDHSKPKSVSKPVTVMGKMTDGGSYTNRTLPPDFTFTFAKGKFVSVYTSDYPLANKAGATAAETLGFTIANWKPMSGWTKDTDPKEDYMNARDPAKAETVVSGDYTIKFDALTAIINGTDTFGTAAVVPSGATAFAAGPVAAKSLFKEKFERFSVEEWLPNPDQDY